MTATSWLLLKLAMVAGVVGLASWVTRRLGHAAGGWMAGLPVIAGPITGLLLLDLAPALVREVCLATLQCQPALMAYLVVMAHAAQRLSWPACLLLAIGAYLATGLLLLALALPAATALVLALASPALGLLVMPRQARQAAAGPVPLDRTELLARMLVACLVAAGVMLGAQHLAAAWAGLLLAAPIAGLVLPAFTLPRHGGPATAALLAGFARGQVGFVVFFAAMVLALPRLAPLPAWLGSVASAVLAGWAWTRWQGRRAAARRGR